MRRSVLMLATVLTSLILSLTLALAATTGQIKGHIFDKETGEPIVGASVLVVGTTTGAMTDPDGFFQILRMDPGTYTLRVSHTNYVTVEITNVIVEVDSTTEIKRLMTTKVTELNETIQCIGTHDILDKFVTDSRKVISQETIKTRPVQTVDALLESVAGVQTTAEGEVFVRGGRAGEVSYIVGGVPAGSTVYSETFIPIGPSPAHGGTAIVNGEPYDAMFFENHGTNPFVDTEDDHFATFAVDVDDASYVMARSYLNDGYIPPLDAVRVEEFINHFHYDYEQPINDAFRATLEAAPSRFGTPNTYLLRVGIKGRDISPENRKPANLVFVIDVSGSMSGGNRLGLVKKSLHLLLDCLTPEDQVGIVVYGSNANVVLNPTRATRGGVIRDAINSLHAGGSTYAEKGIRLGYQMANRVFDPEKINRVILCSDGVANVGETSPDKILKQIKRYADKGITLTSLGFGMGNYNDVLMEKLGNKGDGFYAYVDSYQDALRLFENGGVAALEVIAREVKVQVDFNPATVRSYRLLGYENRDVEDHKFRDDTEDGGEIGSGHACTALFEFKLREQPTSDLLATVYLRHEDPDTKQVSEVNHPFYLGAITGSFEQASSDLRLAAVAVEFAEILRGSYWAKGSDLGELGRLADELYRTAGDRDVEELVRLIETAHRVQDQLAEK